MTDQKLCATCKHWMWPDNEEGYCWKANEEPGAALMWAWDGQNCRIDIWTSATFGCVMHEEREG